MLSEVTLRRTSDTALAPYERFFSCPVGLGSVDAQAHLDAVAHAGNTGKSAFSPTTQDDLVATLSEIIGGTASCEVRLDGSIVKGRECAGDVLLDGTPLVCNDPDGFRVKPDGQSIELLGASCKALALQPTSTLNASFACDDVILL